MVNKIKWNLLLDMKFDALKKHAKELKKEGYKINGLSKLVDNSDDRKLLRKLIRDSKKEKKVVEVPTECGFDNVTQCQKKTSAEKVKEIAEKCGLDTSLYKTKTQQCQQLIKNKGDVKPVKKEKKIKNVIENTEEYKKLDKLNKGDILNKAKELEIDYIVQDDSEILLNKARKQDIILSILNKLKTNDKRKCLGKKYKHLMDTEKYENEYIKELLRKQGITKGIPRKRRDMVDLLCSIEQNGRCDPEQGQWCDDNFVCDARNSPGVCISQSLSTNTSNRKLKVWKHKGKRIIGTEQVLNQLKQALKVKSKQSDKMKNEKNKNIMIDLITQKNHKDRSFYDNYSLDEIINTLQVLQEINDQKYTNISRKDMIWLLVKETGVESSIIDELDDEHLSFKYKELKDDIIMLLVEETGHSLKFFEKLNDKVLYSKYKKLSAEFNMIAKKPWSELKTMNFDQLKEYAKELRKEGYKISGISKLVDKSEDRKLLRKLINDAVLEEEEKKDETQYEEQDKINEITTKKEKKKHTSTHIEQDSVHLEEFTYEELMQKNVEKDKQINKLQNKLEKKEKEIKYLKEENNKLKK